MIRGRAPRTAKLGELSLALLLLSGGVAACDTDQECRDDAGRVVSEDHCDDGSGTYVKAPKQKHGSSKRKGFGGGGKSGG